MADINKALDDPGRLYQSPREVVERTDLTRAEKIAILKRWEYDVRELQVADEEGMAPERPQSTHLDEVLNALRLLDAPADVERSAPTKQGGS
jgi:hypothetical protein